MPWSITPLMVNASFQSIYSMDFAFQTCWMVSLQFVLWITLTNVLFFRRCVCYRPIWYAINGDKIGVATFESALLALGFTDIKKIPANTRMLLDMDSLEILDQGPVFKFDLRQYKTTFDDWNAALLSLSARELKAFARRVLSVSLVDTIVVLLHVN